jgi:hypothetical protein
LYVPRKQGGRGLIRLEEAYIEVMKLMEYVNSKEDPLIKMVRTHQQNISLKKELQKGIKTSNEHHNREDKKKRWQGKRVHR